MSKNFPRLGQNSDNRRQPVGRLRAGVPSGIRTRVTAVKGRCPRPLDDGDFGGKTEGFSTNLTHLVDDSHRERGHVNAGSSPVWPLAVTTRATNGYSPRSSSGR